MKRAIATAMVCGGLALVGATESQAADGQNNGKDEASKACTDLRKADRAAFVATYGAKHSMRTCKKGEELAADETTPGEFKNAAQVCRAQRESDPIAFHAAYGFNKNGKNAFGKCVSRMAQAEEEETPAP